MASIAGTRTISIKRSLQISKGARKASQIPVRISLRRRRDAFTKTTSRADGGLNGSDKNENARALEVKRNFNISSPEISSNPSTLPRPLTASDLSSSVSRSRLSVFYQGLPGAYNESAVAKAYPNCEAVPCELFETVFDAVERWLVDRAVLPIENFLGGSIHLEK